MLQNYAAFITSPRQRPLEIRQVPHAAPEPNQIIIRNRAIGINHIDWKIQDHEFAPFRYPGVLGHESAGEVVEVGSNVSRFRVGDRVLAEGTCMATQKDTDGSFQLYTVVPEHVASPIPDTLSYEKATVLPLGLSTSIMGLYAPDTLELDYPSLKPKPQGETIVVWGGSSSVGSNVIQLAVHAGYEVIATASKHNFENVRNLGATAVFDYHEKTVVDDLVSVLKGKVIKGSFDAVGLAETSIPLANVILQTEGSKRLVSVLGPPADLPQGVVFKMAWAIVNPPQLGLAIYKNFLPDALAKGVYLTFPEPTVIGTGLEQIQEGMDLLSKGVSAKKLVVSL
ncbi:zinc-binding oxidoreductase CipB [Talaromyces proteolyticus]|uniref:Zinc-binding oxidoreductase CipB n=1 Tax=Talaromyces proteolyticus TaxID=1131652 RepID=A0AAD4PWY4_9EURO|nr:zinc-binding oxidoreductase CipB [Talaromyces proteolyticus]KAH8695605.1 zinc-binding oxidoreductase CipB [Talaromyces proteolyticus]